MWSGDGGAQWHEAKLEQDFGKYSFRRWNAQYTPRTKGEDVLMVKAINSNGVEQPMTPNWNTGGFMRNIVESIKLTVG